MTTIALTLEYDGTRYVGWQSQENGVAIQDVLKRAVETRLEEQVTIEGAGRTDSGVHALGQVASFSTSRELPLAAFREGVNLLLPHDIRIVEARRAAPDFHARKSASGKVYVYRILVRPILSALDRDRVWLVKKPLDVAAMREAAERFCGEHDFSSFCAADATASRVKNVRRLAVAEIPRPDGVELGIEIEADGFLKHMVRTIAGSLVSVGRGNRPAEWVSDALAAKARQAGGPTAPPWGLYLKEVRYDPKWFRVD